MKRTECLIGGHGTSGFTLVEMLLVVVIIGVLATVVATQFTNKGETARINATRASISAISTAIDVYKLDTGRLPDSLNNLLQSSGEPNWDGPYLRGAQSSIVDAWGTPFSYTTSGSGSFKVISGGPDRQSGTGDDITSH